MQPSVTMLQPGDSQIATTEVPCLSDAPAEPTLSARAYLSANPPDGSPRPGPPPPLPPSCSASSIEPKLAVYADRVCTSATLMMPAMSTTTTTSPTIACPSTKNGSCGCTPSDRMQTTFAPAPC